MNIKNISKINKDLYHIRSCTLSVYVSKTENVFDRLFWSVFSYEKNFNNFALTEKKGDSIKSIKDSRYIDINFMLEFFLKNYDKNQIINKAKLLTTLFVQFQELIGLNPKKGKLYNLITPSIQYMDYNEEKNNYINVFLGYHETENFFRFSVKKRIKIKKFF